MSDAVEPATAESQPERVLVPRKDYSDKPRRMTICECATCGRRMPAGSMGGHLRANPTHAGHYVVGFEYLPVKTADA